MFRRSGNFRLAINFDELSTVRRFVLVNFSRCDEFQFPSPFALLHVLSFLLLSHEEKNPLIVGIDKRKRFFLSFLVAPIDRPPFNSQPLHFGENRSEREFIGNFVPSPSPNGKKRGEDGSKSALVTRWHRFPGTMQSERRGNPWERRAHFPGTRYFVDKTGSGSLTFCQRCRIVPLLPLLPLGGVPYRPSHCTDSINDAINDSYRYITRNGNYESGIARCTSVPFAPPLRPRS